VSKGKSPSFFYLKNKKPEKKKTSLRGGEEEVVYLGTPSSLLPQDRRLKTLAHTQERASEGRKDTKGICLVFFIVVFLAQAVLCAIK